MAKHITQEEIKKIISLKKQGKAFQVIADILNRPVTTIIKTYYKIKPEDKGKFYPYIRKVGDSPDPEIRRKSILNNKLKSRKIKGTVKFIVYFFNGRAIRNTTNPDPRHYMYMQWGRILLRDENDKTIRELPFSNYGEMINFINTELRKKTLRNIKK